MTGRGSLIPHVHLGPGGFGVLDEARVRRNVGDRDVPWQRVINSRGTVSERRHGGGTSRQRRLLQSSTRQLERPR